MLWLTYDGKNEKGEMIRESNCTLPVLAIQNTHIIGSNKGIQASVESFRNETVQSQKNVLGIANIIRHNERKRLTNGE